LRREVTTYARGFAQNNSEIFLILLFMKLSGARNTIQGKDRSHSRWTVRSCARIPLMNDNLEVQVSRDVGELQRDFVRLFSRHQRQIHAYIGTVLANPADVEEVLQETSIVLWSKFDAYDAERPFVAWACGIAHLQILRHFRLHRRRMLPLDEPTIELLLAERGPLEDALSERRGALAECLARLRDKDRRIIEACYSPGVKIKDVADQLGRPLGALYHTVARIRRTLLQCIERHTAAEARR
jgi:RNA polymerase sigma-70 factor (ECF subfamily)